MTREEIDIKQIKFFLGAVATNKKWVVFAHNKSVSPTKHCNNLFKLPIIGSHCIDGTIKDARVLEYTHGDLRSFDHHPKYGVCLHIPEIKTKPKNS